MQHLPVAGRAGEHPHAEVALHAVEKLEFHFLDQLDVIVTADLDVLLCFQQIFHLQVVMHAKDGAA